MRYRCAVLDDYQNVALTMADWSRVTGDVDVTVFNERLGDEAAVARALQGFGIVCLMRERTPFPRSLIEKLPDLKLIVTTGLKNAAIDVAAAKDRGILVCGTEGAKHPDRRTRDRTDDRSRPPHQRRECPHEGRRGLAGDGGRRPFWTYPRY